LNAQGDGDEGYLGQDVEFMQALVDTEGLHSIHSGHDHGNVSDFLILIVFEYSLKTLTNE